MCQISFEIMKINILPYICYKNEVSYRCYFKGCEMSENTFYFILLNIKYVTN